MTSATHNPIAETLTTAMQSKGYDDVILAGELRRAGHMVSAQSIRNWREGKHEPNSRYLLPIAKALDITVSALLGEDAAKVDGHELRN